MGAGLPDLKEPFRLLFFPGTGTISLIGSIQRVTSKNQKSGDKDCPLVLWFGQNHSTIDG
jgi:hypothetical protein